MHLQGSSTGITQRYLWLEFGFGSWPMVHTIAVIDETVYQDIVLRKRRPKVSISLLWSVLVRSLGRHALFSTCTAKYDWDVGLK